MQCYNPRLYVDSSLNSPPSSLSLFLLCILMLCVSFGYLLEFCIFLAYALGLAISVAALEPFGRSHIGLGRN